jgi:uncharacterized membrane protein YjjB (DUF3815 family)
MARVLLVCPSCHKRLETSDQNVGRDGQCPACQNVFPVVPAPRAAPAGPLIAVPGEGWLGAAGEYEYHAMNALLGVGIVALCLLLLIAASSGWWVKPYRIGADFVPGDRAVVFAVSVACMAYLAMSFVARKSLVPAVLLTAAWGTAATIWTGGILTSIHSAVKAAAVTNSQVLDQVGMTTNIYFALALGILTLIAGVYFYYQCRDSDTFQRIGAFLLATQFIAITVALMVVFTHVKPAVRSAVKGASSAPAAPAPEPSASAAPWQDALPPSLSCPWV